MSETGDPLEGADVGETRTVNRETTVPGIDLEPREFWGRDRQRELSNVDVDLVQNDEDDIPDVKVTWEAEVTKNLPPKWDQCNEPRTPEEERQERRWKWISRGVKAAGVLLPLAGAAWLATYLTNATLAGMTIDGEPVSPVGVEAALPVIALAVLMYLAIRYAPGRINGGRHV